MKRNLSRSTSNAGWVLLGLASLIVATGCSAFPKHQPAMPCDSCPVAMSDDCLCDDCDSACDESDCGCDGELYCDETLYCDEPGVCDTLPRSDRFRLVRGRPNRLLDSTGSVFGFANKIALWDSRADNHSVSPQTEQEILNYLRRNNLDTVLVRSNQYDPIGEWRRLVANKHMSPGWKYTFGAYDWLKYTLIPGRLLGGDWYNPFTDSVHIYSDIPSIGLAKAAYAKDVHSRDYPGTYAAMQDTPLLGLWHEGLAAKEVLSYLGKSGTTSQVDEARRILYPDFGGALGAQVLGFLPYGNVYGRAAGALTGHAYRGITQGGFEKRSTQVARAPSDTNLR